MQLKQMSRILVQFSPWTGTARSARECSLAGPVGVRAVGMWHLCGEPPQPWLGTERCGVQRRQQCDMQQLSVPWGCTRAPAPPAPPVHHSHHPFLLFAGEFLARVTSAPAQKSNPECQVESRVRVQGDPFVEITYENSQV